MRRTGNVGHKRTHAGQQMAGSYTIAAYDQR
jgi:hypothetical protein